MKKYRKPPVSRGWVLSRPVIREIATDLRKQYDIAAPTIETEVRLLSGGNLQKAILAREMSDEPDMIVAVQPTRGLDVGAIEAVHRTLLAERRKGTAILLISEELDELLSLSDRVIGMYEGRVMGEVDSEGASLDEIGLMMAGTPRQAALDSTPSELTASEGATETVS